jgi:hypothetical protein
MTYGNSHSLKRRVTADLVMVAYFFLLRVREYTLTTPKKGSTPSPPQRKAVQSGPSPSGSGTSPSGTTRTPSPLTHRSNDSSRQMESPLTLPTRKTEPKMPMCPTPNQGIKPCAHASPWPAWWQSSETFWPTPPFYQTATGMNQVSNRDILEAVRQGAIRDNLNRSGYDYAPDYAWKGSTRM